MNVYEMMMGSSIRDAQIKGKVYAIKTQFEDDLSYEEITKNDSSVIYKAHIYNGNSYKRDLDVRKIVMYPYQSIKLGDYINWDLGRYLVVGLDARNDWQVTGQIMSCNESLKWKDKDDVVYSIPCVFEITEKQTVTDYRKVRITENENSVRFQTSDLTNGLPVNTRFILGGKAYSIYTWDKSTSDTLTTFYLIDNQVNIENDDLTNGIAYNNWETDTTNDGSSADDRPFSWDNLN